MRNRLLFLFAILLYFGIATGFSAINPEQEEAESIQYEYDELNRVTKAEYPDGTTVTYHYDKNGNLLETIVTPPGEGTVSTTEDVNTTEEMISDREIPEQEMTNQEYAFINGNEESGMANSSLREEGIFSQDKKAGNGTEDLEADGTSDTISDEKNQWLGEEKETAPAEEEKSYLGWILAVVSAGALAAGVIWRNKRRKQDEN